MALLPSITNAEPGYQETVYTVYMTFTCHLFINLHQLYANFEIARNWLTFRRRRRAPPWRPSSTNSNVRHRLNIPQHRNAINFIVNPVAGLLAFTRQTKKLSLHLSDKDLAALPTLILLRTRVKLPEFGVSRRLFKGKSSAAVNAIACLIACIWQSRPRSLRLSGKDMARLPAITDLDLLV